MTTIMNFGRALRQVGGAGRSEFSDWSNSFVTDRGRGQDGDTVIRLCEERVRARYSQKNQTLFSIHIEAFHSGCLEVKFLPPRYLL